MTENGSELETPEETAAASPPDPDSSTTRPLAEAVQRVFDDRRIIRGSEVLPPIDEQARSLADEWKRFALRTIGKRYMDCMIDGFRLSEKPDEAERQRKACEKLRAYCRNIAKHVGDGQGVLFWGPRGTGKDHLGSAVLRAAFRAGVTVGWVDGQTLYERARDKLDSETKEREAYKEFAAPELLMISDPLPQAGALTAFEQSVLWRLLDRRYRDGKALIVTLNVKDGAEAGERLGQQIADRIRDGARGIYCNWESYRKSWTPTD